MKWLSRKFFMAILGLGVYSFVPTYFKNAAVTDTVTLASIGGITIIIGYYFKVNKDTKASGENSDGPT